MDTERTFFGLRGRAVLVSALALPVMALAACGSSDGGGSSTAAGTGASTAPASTAAAADGLPPWCGEKEITLGIADGGGLNAWSQESLNQVELEAKKCPNISKTMVSNAAWDVQKAISGLSGLVAQGANAIVIIPDAGGPAELPGIRKATAAGAKVVPWGSDPGGEAGQDFVTYVDWDPAAAGRTWATWLADTMGGKGNVLYLGGPAGNAVDKGVLTGVKEAFADQPGIKMLTGYDSWPVTNWDPAQAQKTMTGLLTQYPQIDGILMGDGQSSASVVKVLQAAGRPIPPIATLEANQLGCAWEKAKGTKDAFELGTISGRNWMGRIAVRKAVAAANDIAWDEKSIIELPLYEDSEAAGDLTPHCDPEQAPGAYLSNQLPDEQLNALSGAPVDLP